MQKTHKLWIWTQKHFKILRFVDVWFKFSKFSTLQTLLDHLQYLDLRSTSSSSSELCRYAGMPVGMETERCRNAERWFWAAGPWELCFEACRYLQASAAVAISCLLRISETHTAKLVLNCQNVQTCSLYSHCTHTVHTDHKRVDGFRRNAEMFSKAWHLLLRAMQGALSSAALAVFSRPHQPGEKGKDKKKPGGKKAFKKIFHMSDCKTFHVCKLKKSSSCSALSDGDDQRLSPRSVCAPTFETNSQTMHNNAISANKTKNPVAPKQRKQTAVAPFESGFLNWAFHIIALPTERASRQTRPRPTLEVLGHVQDHM